jgi:hypothetical protein
MKRWRVALLIAVLSLVGGTSALADGDPASDTLVFQNVFLPYPAPSADAAAGLAGAIRDVYASGYRIKVAVVASPNDLGAVPSLFNKPSEYAQFLGQELRLYFIGPLLIVMPAGFGIYDGGRSVVAEQRVLSRLTVDAGTPDTLVHSATAAVQRLLGARALVSKDIKAPYAQPIQSNGTRGQRMKLGYMVFDDSGRSAVVVEVWVGKTRKAMLKVPLRQVDIRTMYSVSWLVPKTFPRGPARLCVTGIDPSGNTSPPACQPVLRIS